MESSEGFKLHGFARELETFLDDLCKLIGLENAEWFTYNDILVRVNRNVNYVKDLSEKYRRMCGVQPEVFTGVSFNWGENGVENMTGVYNVNVGSQAQYSGALLSSTPTAPRGDGLICVEENGRLLCLDKHGIPVFASEAMYISHCYRECLAYAGKIQMPLSIPDMNLMLRIKQEAYSHLEE